MPTDKRTNKTAANMGGGDIIEAGRCYLHLQQHSSSCSGRTNIGEPFILFYAFVKHHQ